MVIDDFDVGGPAFRPAKANAVLAVDADRVLSGSRSGKGFETIPWWETEVVEAFGMHDVVDLTRGDCMDGAWARLAGCLRINAIVDILRPLVRKLHDLKISHIGSRYKEVLRRGHPGFGGSGTRSGIQVKRLKCMMQKSDMIWCFRAHSRTLRGNS